MCQSGQKPSVNCERKQMYTRPSYYCARERMSYRVREVEGAQDIPSYYCAREDAGMHSHWAIPLVKN